jgi:hypothetical protein
MYEDTVVKSHPINKKWINFFQGVGCIKKLKKRIENEI